MDDRKKRNLRVLLWILAAAFCGWLFLDVFPGNLSRRMAYRKAESLIRAGDYEEAEAQIGRIWGISEYDREYLMMYCRSYSLYLEGRLQEAAEQYELRYHEWYYRNKMTVWDQPWLDWKAVYVIRDERIRLDKEEEERKQAEYEAWKVQQEKDYQDKVISSEMPFLGMREEDVGRTLLGRYTGDAWEKNESYWYIDKRYTDPNRVGYRKVTHYDFLKDGELILEVFCTDGTVDELARYENGMIYYTYLSRVLKERFEKTYRTTWYPNGYWYNKTKTYTKTNRKTGTGKTGGKVDYANEEDFYEDYADEFENLDEAMDYYLDHYQ